MKQSNKITQELNKLFPDKIVNNLKIVNEDLYKTLMENAKEVNKTLKTYLEEMGYKYVRKPLGQMFAEDYIDLLNNFPEKNVDLLYERNNRLYYRLLNHAKIKDFQIKEYINFLGFEYELYKEEIFLSDIERDLNDTYKDKIIDKLSVTNPLLYSKVYKFAQKENMTIQQLVESIGFTMNEPETNEPKTKEPETKDIPKNTTPKRRGRPPKNNKQTESINNTTIDKKEENTNNNTPKKRGRPPKNNKQNETTNENTVINKKEENTSNSAPKKRGRPPKNNKQTETTNKNTTINKSKENTSNNTPKKRGRPPKDNKQTEITNSKLENITTNNQTTPDAPKRKRGRPRKVQ